MSLDLIHEHGRAGALSDRRELWEPLLLVHHLLIFVSYWIGSQMGWSLPLPLPSWLPLTAPLSSVEALLAAMAAPNALSKSMLSAIAERRSPRSRTTEVRGAGGCSDVRAGWQLATVPLQKFFSLFQERLAIIRGQVCHYGQLTPFWRLPSDWVSMQRMWKEKNERLLLESYSEHGEVRRGVKSCSCQNPLRRQIL